MSIWAIVVPKRRARRTLVAPGLALILAGGCQPGAGDRLATDLPTSPSANPAPADGPQAPSPARPPERPLSLVVPPAPPADYRGIDLAKEDPGALASHANDLAEREDYREAARFQYWAVKGGGEGQYNLACWTSLAGDVEAAFYWLQEAALGDGVDATWAGQDPDLAPLRKDPRWRSVAPFLKQANAYWAVSDERSTVLVVPSGYKPGTPIPAVVGMHGMGSRPGRFIDPETFQPFADELNMAFVGVSGTVPTGKRSFVWSEEPAADARQVRRALDDLKDRLTVKPGHLIAMGFSQGAQLGFEVAFQNPDEYRGAIVVSPGTSKRFFRLSKLTPSPKNKDQAYVCLCGAGEEPGNVQFTKNDADFATKAGARVDLRLAEGQDRHAFPAGFTEALPGWLRYIDRGP